MPRYNYTAKLDPRNIIQAVIEAESRQDAINKITKLGYFPVSVQPEIINEQSGGISRFWKSSAKDLVLFTRQLASLIDSGVNIINGMNIISSQASNKYFKFVLLDVLSKIKDGKSLSDSLSSYPQIFSPLYCAMIRVGEAAGSLNSTLLRLADFLEKEQEVKDTLRSSLVYPAFILVVGFLTVFILLVFVIPRLVGMFEDLGQALPLPTKILIDSSAFLNSYWWIIIILSVLSVFLSRRIIENSRGKVLWDNFKLKLIFLGPIILKNELSRFCRTLSLLLSSGIPISPALDVSTSIINNQVLKTEIQNFKERIANGASLSAVFKGSKLFPDFVTSIVSIGEETGNMDKSLLRIAQDYEKEVDRIIKTLIRLLEPLIILVMGLIVGFIVLSMLLPIFEINLIVR